MNVYLQEQQVAMHRQELDREIAQYRLLAQLPHTQSVRHSIGLLGLLLVKVGTKLQQVETSRKQAVAA
jgi:hypothetical protein